MGGTCLRIVYGTNRFSEDLDFDNFGLTHDEFIDLSQIVLNKLSSEGYIAEIKVVHKGAFRCYIRIPELLYNNSLSGFKEEKILIQLDSEQQGYSYTPDKFLLNKFDVFSYISMTPKNILLSQKIWAILNRKTPKGRDYYDVLFLFSLTHPDYRYLEMKAGLKNLIQLKEKLITHARKIDFKKLVKDVQPFIIQKSDLQMIESFTKYIEALK